MSSYGRVKFAIKAFNNLASKITTPRTDSAIRQFNQYNTLSNLSIAKKTKTSFTSSVSSLLAASTSRSCVSQRFSFGRRYYYVDSDGVHHFRKSIRQRFLDDRMNILKVAALLSGGLVSMYYWNMETVPYTKRTRFVIWPSSLERMIGALIFGWKKKFWRILPEQHPQSVRVRKISENIISALRSGVRNDNVWCASSKSRVQAARKHLDRLDWEVLLVDEPIANAYCYPGGKIVIFTGFLKYLKTDAEIAEVIGHEVGHAAARHFAEDITSGIIEITLLDSFFLKGHLSTLRKYLLWLPSSRKMEIEADYIGLLLMASAGYDPRIAPELEKKLGDKSSILDYMSTHPSGEERAELMAQSMEEALALYEETKAAHRRDWGWSIPQ